MKTTTLALIMSIFLFTSASAQNIQYIYDKAGRLSSSSKDGSATIIYSYDKDGNRLSQMFSNIILIVNPTSLQYSVASSTKKVGVTSNTVWQVSSNQSWATVNKASGNGNDSVIITVGQNTTGLSRSAIVTFTAAPLAQTVTILQGMTSGITENDNVPQQNIEIYPNPTLGVFTISFKNTSGSKQIEVLDANGRLIHEFQTDKAKTEVSLDDARKGLYIIRVITTSNVYTSKILLE